MEAMEHDDLQGRLGMLERQLAQVMYWALLIDSAATSCLNRPYTCAGDVQAAKREIDIDHDSQVFKTSQTLLL